MSRRPQCESCQNWQSRGGVILARTTSCVAFEHEPLQPATLAVLAVMAQQLAAKGNCPAYLPLTIGPDAYRAQDLDERTPT